MSLNSDLVFRPAWETAVILHENLIQRVKNIHVNPKTNVKCEKYENFPITWSDAVEKLKILLLPLLMNLLVSISNESSAFSNLHRNCKGNGYDLISHESFTFSFFVAPTTIILSVAHKGENLTFNKNSLLTVSPSLLRALHEYLPLDVRVTFCNTKLWFDFTIFVVVFAFRGRP